MGAETLEGVTLGGKTKTTPFLQIPTVVGTWYTVLTVTGEQGFLRKVTAVSGAVNPTDLEIRVTYDTANAIIHNTSGLQIKSSGEANSDAYLVVEADDFYNNSLLVEVRHSTTNTSVIQAFVNRRVV